MKVYIASDHGGFKLKEELKVFVSVLGHEIEDVGAFSLDTEDDYPDFILPLAKRVVMDGALGVVLGRSGNGEAIAANKVQGARAAVCTTAKMANLARSDNDANILSMGADFVSIEDAKQILQEFLSTPFSAEERHKRRIKKITDYESPQP